MRESRVMLDSDRVFENGLNNDTTVNMQEYRGLKKIDKPVFKKSIESFI